MRSRRPDLTLAALVLLGAMTVGCWWRIRLLGDVRLHLAAFYGYFALAFCFYLLLLWLIGRWEKLGTVLFVEAPERKIEPSPFFLIGTGAKNRTVPIFLVLLVAVMARLLLLGTTPTLSDDIYRYRWDGRVQQAGIDPYAYPPDHPALASLRDEPFRDINFPHLRTVYPPLTQAAFRLGASLGGTLPAHKLLFVCAELLTILSLLAILKRRGRSLLWVAAYAWHPLTVLEISGSGHNDALGIACLWLGVAAWEARHWMGAALAWAAAFGAKFFSVVLAPWWVFRGVSRGWLIGCLALSIVPFLFHPSAATAVAESLLALSDRGSSNASVYLLLSGLLSHPRAAALLAVGVGGGWTVWWAKRQPDPIRYLLGAVTAAVLLAPAVHPWYLLWAIPCFCFWRVPALIALSGTVVLAYTVWPGRLADGRWVMPVWAQALEYAPVAILALWSMRSCVWRSLSLPVTKPQLSAKS